MKFTRPSRFILVSIMLFSLLFMQFAVAAYSCPNLMKAQVSVSATSPHVAQPDMSGCASEETVQLNLCHAHDRSGSQSLDKPVAPIVQPFIPLSLVIDAVPDIAIPTDNSRQSLLLARTTAPPLSIQHCCFRI